jgi:hypothetical protein
MEHERPHNYNQPPDPMKNLLDDMYWEMFGVERDWALQLEHYDNELGRYFKRQIDTFNQYLKDKPRSNGSNKTP